MTRGRPLPSEIFSGEMVTVKVGHYAKVYKVNRALVTYYCPNFLKAQDTVKTEEGETDTITLTNIDSYIFEIFADWMYTQSLPAPGDWHPLYTFPAEFSTAKVCILLYMFAVRFQIPTFKDAVKQTLLKILHSRAAQFDATDLAFGELAPNSPVLKMLVDAHCRNWSPHAPLAPGPRDPSIERYPPEFLRRVLHEHAFLRDHYPPRFCLESYRE